MGSHAFEDKNNIKLSTENTVALVINSNCELQINHNFKYCKEMENISKDIFYIYLGFKITNYVEIYNLVSTFQINKDIICQQFSLWSLTQL